MLKATSIVLIILALFSLIMGIVYVIQGTFMPYHEQFIGMTMEDIREFNPNLATLGAIFIRLAGMLFISMGIFMIAVVYYGLRRAERWAWWATLIGFGVANAAMVAVTKPVGGFPWTSAIITLIVFLIVIGLAGTKVFKKTAEKSAQ